MKRKSAKKKMTRRDMARRWPTNVYLWSFLQCQRWLRARP